MVRKINYGKILLVIFLTVLIWVWADLALDDELPVSGATISIAKSTNPNLWVSFDDDESSVSVDNILLKGPASRIGNARRKLNDGSLVLAFFLDAEQEGLTDPGEHPLDVLAFLKKSSQTKELGLTVESCEPDKLSVNVVKLVKKSLTVKCFDEDGIPLKAESIPSKVDMFVPGGWEGEKLTAEVQLTRGEIEPARWAPIEKRPYVELAAGQRREAATPVKIKLPPEADPRSDYFVTATLAIALSPNLQGRYKVVVSNLDAVMERIAIRATLDAKRAYELQPYPPMTLYIFDDDAQKGTEEQQREVVYNFPPEFVRKGEIELKNPDPPVVARFKLIELKLLPSATASSTE